MSSSCGFGFGIAIGLLVLIPARPKDQKYIIFKCTKSLWRRITPSLESHVGLSFVHNKMKSLAIEKEMI